MVIKQGVSDNDSKAMSTYQRQMFSWRVGQLVGEIGIIVDEMAHIDLNIILFEHEVFLKLISI